MPVLTAQQVAAYAYGAGFRNNDLIKAVWIAKRESSYNTDVVNSLGCVGLWQIYQKVHPELKMTIDELKNPAKNAAAAKTIHDKAGNWSPWSTDGDGWKTDKEAIEAAVNANKTGAIDAGALPGEAEARKATGEAVGGAVSGAVSALNPLSGLDTLTKVFRDSALTYLVVLVALVLVVLGVVLLARNQVADVLPAGKALKIVKAVT